MKIYRCFSKEIMKANLITDNPSGSRGGAALLGVTLLFIAAALGQKTTDYYAHLKPEHATAVKNYVAAKNNLRPAQISDCKNKFGLDSLRQTAGKSAHPFYAVADFNRDKVSDFAVVLYDSKKAEDARFTILIFNGVKSGGYKLAHKTENADLREGGIWTYGFSADGEKPTVTAGEYETDNCIWIEWERGQYVVHDCAEMEN